MGPVCRLFERHELMEARNIRAMNDVDKLRRWGEVGRTLV